MVRGNSKRGARGGPRRAQRAPDKFKKGFKGPKKDKRPKKDLKKKPKSEDQLNREIEEYWGTSVGAQHLDRELDDYWKGKKDTTEPKP